MTRPATLRPMYFYTALDAYRAREGSELARAGAPTDRRDPPSPGSSALLLRHVTPRSGPRDTHRDVSAGEDRPDYGAT